MPADNANGSSKAIVNASLSWERCLLSLLVLQKFLNGAEHRMLKTSIGHQAMTTKPQAQRQRQSEGMECRDQRQAGLDEHPRGISGLELGSRLPRRASLGPFPLLLHTLVALPARERGLALPAHQADEQLSTVPACVLVPTQPGGHIPLPALQHPAATPCLVLLQAWHGWASTGPQQLLRAGCYTA